MYKIARPLTRRITVPRKGITKPAGGKATLVLPTGATAWWSGTDYVSSPRKAIPNRIINATVDANLLTAPRRLFTVISYWNPTNLTVTDQNQTAPDGSNEASTITNGGTNWFLSPNPNTFTVPAGTYTLAISVKWLGTGSANFKLGDFNSTLGTKTATGSWQRFTQTFTTTGSIFPLMQSLDGTSAANFAVCDFQLFAGSSDLNTNALSAKPISVQNSDLVLGQSHFDNSASVSGSVFIHGGRGLFQLPSLSSMSAITVMYIAKSTGAPSSSSFQPIIAVPNYNSHTWNDLSIGPVINSRVGQNYNGSQIDASFDGLGQSTASLWGLSGGKFCAAHRYDGATASSFINGVKLLNNATVVAAPSVGDFYVGVLQDSFYSGFDISQIVIWPRALSDAEIRQAYQVMTALTPVDSSRIVVFDGTSISAGSAGVPVAMIIGSNLNPARYGVDVASGGATLATLSARASSVDALMTNASPQTSWVLSIEIGANDLGLGNPYVGNPSGFTAALATYLDARRAAGWKVVAHTIMGRTDQGDGGTQFNSDRATANTTIRSWVSVHCDALADWAADATMGTDTAPNNTTNFADKLHPTSTGYTFLEPIDRAAINSLS